MNDEIVVIESKYHQETDNFRRDFLIAFVIILISTIILVAIDLIISFLVKNQLDQDILDKVILPSSAFAPEQIERTQYLASLLIFPILCFAGWLLSNKLKNGNERYRAILYPAVAFAVTAGIGLWLYFTLEKTGFLYVTGFTFLTLSFYLIFLGVVYIEWKYSPKWLSVSLKSITIVIGLFLLLTIVFMCLNTEYDLYSYSYHFNAYFYSVVQVFGGKILLIDITNLYGFYPYFLQPIFKILGLDVIQLTAVTGVLLAGHFLILFFLITRVIRSRIIAICALLAIPGDWLWTKFAIGYDPYFQYCPHRVLFPGLLLFIAWFYQKSSGAAKYLLYYLAFVVSGIALLWNLDAGVVVFGTWVLFLYYETLGQWTTLRLRKTVLVIGKHTLIALTVVILSFGSLYIYTFVRSGFFPDMGKYTDYQMMFYGAGLAMIPMPLIHPWNLVALIYMVGICISFNSLVKNMHSSVSEEDQAQSGRVNMIFIISIMGAGLFSYYQGRSHDYNLFATLWSTFFLIAIYADSLLWHISKDTDKTSSIKYNRATNIATGSLFLLLSVILVCYAGGIVELFPKFAGRIQTQIQALWQINTGTSIPSDYIQNINFIKKYFSPGDEVLLIVGNQQTMYYMESETTNPVANGFVELFYKIDQQKIFDYLMDGTVVNQYNRRVPVRIIMSDDYKSSEYFQMVNENYNIIDRVNDLTLFEKRFP